METQTIIALVVGLGSLGGVGLGFLTFWLNFSSRVSDANATAQKAEGLAKEAKADAHETATTLAIQTAAFSLFREQVAKEYIHREVMREVETRLTDAINRLGDRLDKVLSKIGN